MFILLDFYDVLKILVPILLTFFLNLYIKNKAKNDEKNKILFSTLELFEKTLDNDLFCLKSMQSAMNKQNLDIVAFILQPLQIKFNADICIKFFSYNLELNDFLIKYLQMREYWIKRYTNGINKKQLEECIVFTNGLRAKVHLDKQSLRCQLMVEQSRLLRLRIKYIQLSPIKKICFFFVVLLLFVVFLHVLFPMIFVYLSSFVVQYSFHLFS